MREFTRGMTIPMGSAEQAAFLSSFPARPPLPTSSATSPRPAVPAPSAPAPATAPAAAPAMASGAAPTAAPAQERGGFLRGFFGPEGRDARARLAIALEGMTMNPNQALVGELQRGIQARETEAQRNKTVEWLRSRGHNGLADALETGSVDAASVINEALAREKAAAQPVDPLAAINLEIKRAELDRMKSGLDVDPNVQSSQNLPDQSGVLVVRRDGSVEVRPVSGGVLTGQAAQDFVRASQENAAEYQRSIYGARELGKAEGAATAAAPGEIELFNTLEFQVNDLLSDPYLPNMLGPLKSRLPNVTADAARVQSKMDQIQGGAFLQARQLLKGGGAITDFESQKAEQAFIRMNAAQEIGDFTKAMNDFLDAVRAGLPKLQGQTGGAAAPTAAPAVGMPSDDELLRMYGGNRG